MYDGFMQEQPEEKTENSIPYKLVFELAPLPLPLGWIMPDFPSQVLLCH